MRCHNTRKFSVNIPAMQRCKSDFDFARLHYDLQRRYNDRSFCDTVVRLSPERALELYSQVLLKIDSHYVEVPQWKDLVDRGSDNLEVALSEPTFIARNVRRGRTSGTRRVSAANYAA